MGELAEARDEGRSAGLAEGHRVGLAEGRSAGLIEDHNAGFAEGEEKKLIGMVCKKLSKGKYTEEIVKEFAEEFEEDAGRVKRICEAAESFAPEYDCDGIYDRLQEIQKRQ